jgi:hypothetical protein
MDLNVCRLTGGMKVGIEGVWMPEDNIESG